MLLKKETGEIVTEGEIGYAGNGRMRGRSRGKKETEEVTKNEY